MFLFLGLSYPSHRPLEHMFNMFPTVDAGSRNDNISAGILLGMISL